MTREDLVEHRAQRVDIGTLIGRLPSPGGLLGRHVRRSSNEDDFAVRLGRAVGLTPARVTLAAALVLVALLIPAQPGFAAILNAMLAGVLLTGAGFFVAGVVRRASQPAAASADAEATPDDAASEGGVDAAVTDTSEPDTPDDDAPDAGGDA